DDVVGAGDEARTLLDQVIATFGTLVERRAGDGEDLAVLFEREARGDQRARALGRFDHDDAECNARDKAIAAREVLRTRLPAERHFGQQHAAMLDDAARERNVL